MKEEIKELLDSATFRVYDESWWDQGNFCDVISREDVEHILVENNKLIAAKLREQGVSEDIICDLVSEEEA